MSTALHTDRFRREYPDVVEFGVVYLALAALPTWRTTVVSRLTDELNGLLAPPSGGGIVVAVLLWLALGMGGFAVVYARGMGVSVPWDRPDRNALVPTALAVGGALGAAAALTAGVHLLLDGSVSAVTHRRFSPAVSARFLATTVLVPNLATGLGFALLFNGAIQERLRDRYTPRTAIAAVALLAGLYHWYALDSVAGLPRTLLLWFVLAMVVATGYSVVVFGRMDGDPSVRAALTWRRVAALALVGVLCFGMLVDVFSGATEAGELLDHAAWFAVFAVAAVAHERTRSVWVPAATVATFATVRALLPYAESVLGVVPPL